MKDLKTIRYADTVKMERPPGSGTTVVSGYHQPVTTDATHTTESSGTTDTTPATATTEQRKWSRPNLDQLNLKIPVQFKRQVEMWCFMNGISMAQAYVEGMRLLMERGTSGDGGVRGTTGSPILIDDSGIDDVIILYRELTKNKFTDADRIALSEVSDTPAEKIEVGIALSVARAKNRVNSFRYCLGAIREVAEAPVEDYRQYLAYVKSKIRRRREGK